MRQIVIIFAIILFLFSCGGTKAKIEIDYPGSWEGAISRGWSKAEFIKGKGKQVIEIGDVDYTGATIQKTDDRTDTLSVKIIDVKTGKLLSGGASDVDIVTVDHVFKK